MLALLAAKPAGLWQGAKVAVKFVVSDGLNQNSVTLRESVLSQLLSHVRGPACRAACLAHFAVICGARPARVAQHLHWSHSVRVILPPRLRAACTHMRARTHARAHTHTPRFLRRTLVSYCRHALPCLSRRLRMLFPLSHLQPNVVQTYTTRVAVMDDASLQRIHGQSNLAPRNNSDSMRFVSGG